jgi:hypothetical protein
MLADTTVCIAASVEAKTFGVKTGTKVADASACAPEIEFVIARHELYIDYPPPRGGRGRLVRAGARRALDRRDGLRAHGRWREPRARRSRSRAT